MNTRPMTPLHIMLMIHYSVNVKEYALEEPSHRRSQSVQDYRAELVAMGLLTPVTQTDPDKAQYAATETGRQYIDDLKTVLHRPLTVEQRLESIEKQIGILMPGWTPGS